MKKSGPLTFYNHILSSETYKGETYFQPVSRILQSFIRDGSVA